ncbi:MAG: hypothetical protein A3E87_05025 [Gammaproteobacteria bacterium RIFCSPHIGHO2_12_FULL_35_23]|nr:MAG: hypothetical protein A3E87_05025 [Gammaproteobacteria bacterium RIFCSPHIGHO2_12_FULL_35_23]
MILCVLQARMSSTRLPSKVLKKILNTPMLALQIERIKRSKYIDQLVVATSEQPEDLAICKLCKEVGVDFFQGSLQDVLSRYYQVSLKYRPEHVVRLTGDCPLIDWEIIDLTIEQHLKNKNDYTANVIEPTYPDGLDVEVMSFKTLQTINSKAVEAIDREHVTQYIYRHKQEFILGSVKQETNHSHLRWTVDEPEDFDLIRNIFESLYPKKSDFKMNDILQWLKNNPELAIRNQQYKRNEALTKKDSF